MGTDVFVQLLLIVAGLGVFIALVTNFIRTGQDIPTGILTILGLIFGQLALNILKTVQDRRASRREEPPRDSNDKKEGAHE